MTPNAKLMEEIGKVFEDYIRPAGSIHFNPETSAYTLLIRWGNHDALLDVTHVINEAEKTGALSASGYFKATVDDMVYNLAKEIVAGHAKIASAITKRQIRLVRNK